MSARRPTPSAAIAERVTALETAWASLPEKLEAAMLKAAEKLGEQHADIERRLRDLERQHAYAAGAVKVENRVDDQAQQWARTLIPLVWPICLAVSAYFFAGGFNAG